MKKYTELIRIKHWIKNGLIFLPLIFNGTLLDNNNFLVTFIAFLSFSLMASAVYIMNDLVDVEKDKKHESKKNRPIASGKIKKQIALFMLFVLIILSITILSALYFTTSIQLNNYITSLCLLLTYLLLNVFYSFYAKKIPLIEIIILSVCFIIRVYFGGSLLDITISNWLYLTILSFSFYLAIAKRRGELKMATKDSRDVLQHYTLDYLSRMLYIFLTLTLVFYSLWCTSGTSNSGNDNMLLYSILILFYIIMKYSLIIENDSEANPVDVFLNDKSLLFSSCFYMIYMFFTFYL